MKRRRITVLKLYPEIERIAKDVVKNYTADVTIHDRGTVASLQPGDSVLWGCRESGSHIARLDFADPAMTTLKRSEATIANRRHFHAVNAHWPETRWYLLTVLDHDGHGTVEKLNVKRAEQLFADRVLVTVTKQLATSSSPRG